MRSTTLHGLAVLALCALGFSILVHGPAPGAEGRALDERVAGVVSVAGFTALRLEGARRGHAVRRLAQDLALAPRLGFFVGEEPRIPYDFHEVLALVAPRPVLVVQPILDWETNFTGVAACCMRAEPVYDLFGAASRLQRWTPDDYNRYGPELQAEVNRRLREWVVK
jgi:hypothetical protein